MSDHRFDRSPVWVRLVPLVIVVGLGTVWSQMAGAKPGNTSPAGSYTLRYWLFESSANPYTSPLTLKKNGQLSLTTFHMTDKGTWKEASNIVTLKMRTGPDRWTYTIQQSGANLGSKSHPGKVTLDGKPWPAKWYALRNTSKAESRR
jgi:hypothetical protein